MPFPSETFIQFIRNPSHWIAQEFDSVYAQLQGWMGKEHTEDGAHAAITADSVTTTGAGTFGGAGTFDGNVTAQAHETTYGKKCVLGDGVLSADLSASGALIGGTAQGWYLCASTAQAPASGGKEFDIYNLNQSTSLAAFRVLYDAGNSRYLITVPTGGAAYALGENSSGKRVAFIAASALNLAGGTDLTHYSEGTWTPALKLGGNSTGMTYTTQSGVYTRVGRLATVSGYITLSALGSSTGNATITGLPFTAASSPPGTAVAMGTYSGVTFPGTACGMSGHVQNSTTTIKLYYNTTTTSVDITDTVLSGTFSLAFSASYIV